MNIVAVANCLCGVGGGDACHRRRFPLRPPLPFMADRMTRAEFWPYYLREHARPLTRGLHMVGSLLAVGWVVFAVVQRNPWWLLAALVSGYGFAWAAHLLVERNRPATFTYPWQSFASDWRMLAAFLTGRLGRELEKAGVARRRRS